jgi:hypothetical protein
MTTVLLGGLFEYTRRPIFVSASVQNVGLNPDGKSLRVIPKAQMGDFDKYSVWAWEGSQQGQSASNMQLRYLHLSQELQSRKHYLLNKI